MQNTCFVLLSIFRICYSESFPKSSMYSYKNKVHLTISHMQQSILIEFVVFHLQCYLVRL